MELSVVTTLYNSAPYVAEFHARASAAARRQTEDYEIVLVNDGSPDRSLEAALELYRQDPRVKVVDLARNFGHHRAMMTGLGHARGDLVFLIDCDLEEQPELLGPFAEKLRETGADVVFGVARRRKGGPFERLSGTLFYRLFNTLSNQPIAPNQAVARLMTRRYVASLVAHREREVFIAGLWALTGYLQVPVAIDKRHKGGSAYSLRRKLALMVNSVTSFSSRPLVHIFYLGCLILILSLAMAATLIIRKIFFGTLLAGWPSLMVTVWFLGGLSIFCIGIVGIYLSKIFTEVKDRPYTIVRAVYGRDTGEA
jgi:putative glycosyltransferase